MKQTYTIPKTSKKQAAKNRAISKTKKKFNTVCACKNCNNAVSDAAHLLPRSTYPEYYTEEWNLTGMCRYCHGKYDNDLKFRQKQSHLIDIVKQHDELAANRYFKL